MTENIFTKLIEGSGNVSFTTGKVSLTEYELCLMEKEEWARGRTGFDGYILSSEWYWLNRYTDNRDITWSGLAKIIRERNTKEYAEILAAVNKVNRKYFDTTDDARTERHNSIATLPKRWNKDAVKIAVKEVGISDDFPELDPLPELDPTAV